MTESVAMTIRLDAATKRQVEATCEKMGLSFATAVNMLAKAIIREKRIPFEVTAGEEPNEETVAAIMEDGDDLLGPFRTVAEMMEAMHVEY